MHNLTGARNYSLTKFGQANFVGGINGNASNFSNGAVGVNYYSNSSFNDIDDFNTGITISGWFNVSGNPAADSVVFAKPETAAWGSTYFLVETDGQVGFLFPSGGAGTRHLNLAVGTVTDGKWHPFAMTHNITHDCLYIDGSQRYCYTSATLMNGANGVYIGGEPTLGYGSLQSVDELYFFNKFLTPTEVESLNTTFYPFITIDTPTFVPPTPPDGASNRTNQTINMSCCADCTYYLWFENDTNPTNMVLKNTSYGNWTTTIIEEDKYYYKGLCAQNGVYSANTTIRNYILDITMPSLTINPNNFFKASNSSTSNQYSNNIIINISASDNDNIFAFSINISKGGAMYYN